MRRNGKGKEQSAQKRSVQRERRHNKANARRPERPTSKEGGTSKEGRNLVEGRNVQGRHPRPPERSRLRELRQACVKPTEPETSYLVITSARALPFDWPRRCGGLVELPNLAPLRWPKCSTSDLTLASLGGAFLVVDDPAFPVVDDPPRRGSSLRAVEVNDNEVLSFRPCSTPPTLDLSGTRSRTLGGHTASSTSNPRVTPTSVRSHPFLG